MYVERSGLHGTFTVDYLDRRAAGALPTDPLVHDGLFAQTKTYYKTDELFSENDRLDISAETFRRIVKQLERFDLSKTGDDIKGLAFERFLGSTFRGELGQFFTPRPIVNFVVDLLDPKEGELICDPAAGSGGFLIRAFEHVRGKILDDIQRQKDAERARIEALGLPEEEEERQIEAAFARLNRDLLPSSDDNKPVDTRVGRLAWRCIFGTDAEPRAARTAKMNMIMHGDGHGGIHYHDGFVDVNGIFPARFHVVITNPPFGSNVGSDQIVGMSEQTRIVEEPAAVDACRNQYGLAWAEAYRVCLRAKQARTPVLDLYEIGKGKKNRPSEELFVERCLQLLVPGGRLGIVLPDGELNNPTSAWLRRWVEGKARLLAVVSLPEGTFKSAAASAKASLVFLQRFTAADEEAWEQAWTTAHATHDPVFDGERDRLCAEYGPRIARGGPTAQKIVDQLAALGIRRELPPWRQGDPPLYPRGIGATTVGKPQWVGESDKDKQIATLKAAFNGSLDAETKDQAEALHAELRAKLREVDERHTAALWDYVREAFDYPVFSSAPEAVGITSSGAEGPNELPQVLEAYRQFRAWVDAGAQTGDEPLFR
jgi:type I restriction enzyme M protein